MTTATHKFQRRDFLKLMGIGLASALVAPSSPLNAGRFLSSLSLDPEIQFGDLTLKGDRSGHIQQRTELGLWQTIASFGEHCSVTAFMVEEEWLYVTMQVQGSPFTLKTTDARIWRTLG